MAISEFLRLSDYLGNFEYFKKYKGISRTNIFFSRKFPPLKPFLRKNGIHMIEAIQVSSARKIQLNTYKNGKVMHFSISLYTYHNNHNIKRLFFASFR